MQPDIEWFRNARYGLFIHYGLYSLLERGEWVLNREAIPFPQYARLAEQFTAKKFDADELLWRAKQWGMRYAILTCKHHDGFCLYDSKLTDFTTTKTACKRDLVGEFVAACRKHGLRIALYHSLNDWTHEPNSVDALERGGECYQAFIDFAHGQIREILTNYGKIDIMWFDGWWPFTADGWQARKLIEMVRKLQPGILVNDRTGLAGDYGTPEKHIASSGRPWEACMTLNEHWGFHRGDQEWKSPKAVAEMLRQCAAGCGNLVINVGPEGDGSVPRASLECLDTVGQWLGANGEAIYDTVRCEYDMFHTGAGIGDWDSSGAFTANATNLFWHVRYWPGPRLVLTGLECKVVEASLLATGERLPFRQEADRLVIEPVPEEMDTTMPVVIRLRTKGLPRIYRCGGARRPKVPHPRYDPTPFGSGQIG